MEREPAERAFGEKNNSSSYRPRKSAPQIASETEARSRDAAVLDINLSAIAENWGVLDRMGPAEAAAVVKADAYGCLARAGGPALERAGCRTFFTAALSEATRLSELVGPATVIYVLNGYAPQSDWPVDPRIRPVLNTLDEATAWAARAAPGPAALQIETGMNRLGMTAEEQSALGAAPALEALTVELVLSHLASAASAQDPLLLAQKSAFDAALPRLRALYPDARASLSATAGALLGPDYAYDLIRPGIGLYGGLPFPGAQSVLSLSAPILRVWDVETGARSGYDGDWVAERPSRLATIPIGYADGAPRRLAGRWRARLAQGEAPLAGRISMDLIVIDVTDLDPAPRPGDPAWLLDEVLTVGAMAQAAGTISYEILTGLNAARRMERRLNSV